MLDPLSDSVQGAQGPLGAMNPFIEVRPMTMARALFDNLHDPRLFIPFLALVWAGSCWSISAFSGWKGLAEHFRADRDVAGERFRFVSGSLRSGMLPTRFNNCLGVTIAPGGFGVSMLFVVRLFHPPLFFPWAAVQAMLPKRSIFSQSVVVTLRGLPQELVLHGQPAKDLLAAFNAHQQTRQISRGATVS